MVPADENLWPVALAFTNVSSSLVADLPSQSLTLPQRSGLEE